MNISAKQSKPSIKWKVPSWSYLPEHFRRFRHEFHPRVLALDLIVLTIGLLVLKLLPDFELDRFEPHSPFVILDLLKLGITLFLPFYFRDKIFFVAGAYFRPVIRIKKGKFHFKHYKESWQCDQNIQSAEIQIFSPARMRLKIHHLENEKPQLAILGLASGINLLKLSDSLPVKPSILDARQRFMHRRRSLKPTPNPFRYRLPN